MQPNPAPRLFERDASLDGIRLAAGGCRACHLYENATQPVFGDGPRRAPLLLVGEQPGDEEDPEGEPLVGSAGRLLDRALEEAGIDRAPVYITNVVKHFKWKPKGKRRIHGKPNAEEINACRPWQRSVPPRSCDLRTTPLAEPTGASS
ncbi:MAG: uracil-DNA glycosylase family protein [Acidimicrobiia bacterium]